MGLEPHVASGVPAAGHGTSTEARCADRPAAREAGPFPVGPSVPRAALQADSTFHPAPTGFFGRQCAQKRTRTVYRHVVLILNAA